MPATAPTSKKRAAKRTPASRYSVGKFKPVVCYFEEEMLAAVDEYFHENRHKSRMDAIRALVGKALEHDQQVRGRK